jgi:hypothetical protein
MASTNIQRVHTSAPTANTKCTISVWVKRSALNSSAAFGIYGGINAAWNAAGNVQIGFNDDQAYIWFKTASGDRKKQDSTRKFRDTNAWYHFVYRIDTTQGTASDRIRVYCNNEEITSWGSTSDPTSSEDISFTTNGYTNYIGKFNWTNGTANYFDGILSHFHLCDGYSYAPTEFGETDSTTGEWKIKTSPNVNYGNNGYFILKDGNSLTDQSGNGNNWSTHNGTLTATEDCPSNVFATLNILDQAHISTQPTMAYGNTQWTASGNSSSNCSMRGTIGASSGKYYFEAKLLEATHTMIGFHRPDVSGAWYDNTGYMGNNSGFYAILLNGTDTIRSVVAGSDVGSDFGTVSNNDIIGCAFDFDNSKFYFSKNGSWLNSGDPTSGSTGTGAFGSLASGHTYIPAICNQSYGTASSTAFNFGNGYFGTTAVSSAGTNASGNGIFEYDTPTGFTALSTKGLNL